MLVLDTDHLAEIERNTSAGLRLKVRLDASRRQTCITIVSAEEQLRGWMAAIARQRTPHQQVHAYAKLKQRLELFGKVPLLPWTTSTADRFLDLRRQGVRIGTMDLKIASIVLALGYKLLSRNLADFGKVPGLDVEDWL